VFLKRVSTESYSFKN